MQARQTQQKTAPKKQAAPYPSIITQVSKEDEKKSQNFDLFSLYRCCSIFWKCLPLKKKENPMTETTPSLLAPQLPEHKGKKVLVLDLDETLVHSTFEPVVNPDLILPVRIQGVTYRINVIKRPGAEEFLAQVGEMFEVVVFTASLAEYAEPLVKHLDPTGAVTSLLYRQHCTPLNGIYVKDMSLLGRDMKDIILVDNSPNSFLFQPENAYHIKNFFDDKTDRELIRLAAFLDNIYNMKINDIRPVEDMRKRYEPREIPRAVRFVKVDCSDSGELEAPVVNASEQVKQTVKRKEDRERTYNIETEPDLRSNGREQDFPPVRINSVRDKNQPKQGGFYSKASALTERVPANDRFGFQSSESSVDIELPNSPKESDALINHHEADAYFEKDSNSQETDSKDSKKEQTGKGKNPAYNKSNSAVLTNLKKKCANIVAVDEPEIEGHKVEEVRYHTGIDNLNSPLGRHVKIEFDVKKNPVAKEGV